MNFYYISSDYIEYMRQFEPKIQDNYSDGKSYQKPYIGVVFEIGKLQYFAPLTSPKAKFEQISDSSPAIFKIRNSTRLLGVVSLNNMLPVPQLALTPVIFNELDEHYRNLLRQQYRVLSSEKHSEHIKNKAKKLYQLVETAKHPHFKKLSCHFTLLEQKLLDYESRANGEIQV